MITERNREMELREPSATTTTTMSRDWGRSASVQPPCGATLNTSTSRRDSEQPANNPFQTQQDEQRYVYRIGIYGWRKRCLYFLVIILATMLILNLALTIWIIRVMDFSIDGMGRLRIFRGGLRLEGESQFLHTLYAAKIQSRKEHPIKIESSRNITINARNKAGKITNQLYVGPNTLESFAEQFTIKNRRGEVLFQADDKEVLVAAQRLRVTGSGGVRFEGSVQTPHVRAEPFQQLRLESPTRTLHLKAPEGIGIESRAGDISAACLKDLRLHSKQGRIWLDSERIELKNLKTVIPTPRGKPYPGIYQLCTCDNGRLFLAKPDKTCEADTFFCQ